MPDPIDPGPSSGLELARPPRTKSNSAMTGVGVGRPIVEGAGLRPRVAKPVDTDEDHVDSSTSGAAMVLALGNLLFALVLGVRDPSLGVELLVVAAVGALITFVIYYVTGWLWHTFGVVAFILCGGWYSFLVGMIAQGIHMVVPLRWWMVGLAYAGVAAFLVAR